jgi:hypothetical protein
MIVKELQFAAFQRPATFGRENEAFAKTGARKTAGTAAPAVCRRNSPNGFKH